MSGFIEDFYYGIKRVKPLTCGFIRTNPLLAKINDIVLNAKAPSDKLGAFGKNGVDI